MDAFISPPPSGAAELVRYVFRAKFVRYPRGTP